MPPRGEEKRSDVLLLQLELLQLCVCSSAGIAERAAIFGLANARQLLGGEGEKKAGKNRVCKRKSHTELHAAFCFSFFDRSNWTRLLILSVTACGMAYFFGRCAGREKGRHDKKNTYKNTAVNCCTHLLHLLQFVPAWPSSSRMAMLCSSAACSCCCCSTSDASCRKAGKVKGTRRHGCHSTQQQLQQQQQHNNSSSNNSSNNSNNKPLFAVKCCTRKTGQRQRKSRSQDGAFAKASNSGNSSGNSGNSNICNAPPDSLFPPIQRIQPYWTSRAACMAKRSRPLLLLLLLLPLVLLLLHLFVAMITAAVMTISRLSRLLLLLLLDATKKGEGGRPWFTLHRVGETGKEKKGKSVRKK